jgi:hypothetical protein
MLQGKDISKWNSFKLFELELFKNKGLYLFLKSGT